MSSTGMTLKIAALVAPMIFAGGIFMVLFKRIKALKKIWNYLHALCSADFHASCHSHSFEPV